MSKEKDDASEETDDDVSGYVLKIAVNWSIEEHMEKSPPAQKQNHHRESLPRKEQNHETKDQQQPSSHGDRATDIVSAEGPSAPGLEEEEEGGQDAGKESKPSSSSSSVQAEMQSLKKQALLEEEDSTETEAEVWNEYKCNSLPFAAKKHPGDVVEPASLAAIRLPDNLPYPVLESLKTQCENGSLSELQLESIAYALRIHRHFLADGKRMGFFIGDSAGVGKGRQISGIILDNYCRGRRKHVWFSTSMDLAKDAKRDLKDIGCTIPVHTGFGALDRGKSKGLGLSKEFSRGVFFSTYTGLVSKSGNKNRFEQLCSWLGEPESFDGCIIFDEAHKAKNYSEQNGKAGSAVAKAVVEIQRRFPLARCVYVSATAITDITNMAYMERLGIWGKGASFATFSEFNVAMGKRNLGALEMLAMELKSSGMYVSRGLSYRNCSFETITAELENEQLWMYSNACKFFLELKANFEAARDLADGGKEKMTFLRPFWSTHQRFFKQLCIAMKVPTIVRLAKEILEKDTHCVVIGLQSTGEAAIDFHEGGVGSWSTGLPVCYTNNISLVYLIETHFPTLHSPSEEIQNDATTLSVFQGKKKMLDQMKADMLKKAVELPLPPSPLDDLIHQLGGPSEVAEMTGRRNRIVVTRGRLAAEGKPLSHVAKSCEVVPRVDSTNDSVFISSPSSKDKAESLNIQEKEAFMNGDKLVAIISDAASTGISLHSDKRVKNQRRRVHITAELPWSADAAIQQLGRSHRSHQAIAPEYKLLSSGVGGENRFVSAVAARLQSLGALTRGDRRSTNESLGGDFNFNTQYGRQALKEIYASAQRKRVVANIDWNEVVARSKSIFDAVDADPKKLGSDNSGNLYWDVGLVPQTEAQFIECVYMGLTLMELDCPTPDLAHALSKPLSLQDSDLNNTKRFLNKMLGLPVHIQGLLFNYFACNLERIINQAKIEGVYDEGISDIHSNHVTLTCEPEQLYVNPSTAGKLMMYTLNLDRGVSLEDAISLLKEAVDSKLETLEEEERNAVLSKSNEEVDLEIEQQERKPDGNLLALMKLCRVARNLKWGGFYKHRVHSPNSSEMVLAIRKQSSKRGYTLFRPNTGRFHKDKTEGELNRTYKLCSVRKSLTRAVQSWSNVYETTEQYCIHGKDCKKGSTCNIGTRLSKMGLLSGCVVPLWNELQSALNHESLELSKADRILRIVRAELDDGTRIIGIRWPIHGIPVLKAQIDGMIHNQREIVYSKLRTDHICNAMGFQLSRVGLQIVAASPDAKVRGIQVGDILWGIQNEVIPRETTEEQVEQIMRTHLLMLNHIRIQVRTPQAKLAQNVASGRIYVAGSNISVEPVTPINPKAAHAATQKEKTMFSYFRKPKKEVPTQESPAAKKPKMVNDLSQEDEEEAGAEKIVSIAKEKKKRQQITKRYLEELDAELDVKPVKSIKTDTKGFRAFFMPKAVPKQIASSSSSNESSSSSNNNRKTEKKEPVEAVTTNKNDMAGSSKDDAICLD